MTQIEKRMRVLAPLSIRAQPTTAAKIVGQLERGEVIAAAPLTLTTATGYVWLHHARGWSAAGTIDKRETFMLPPDAGEESHLLAIDWISQVDADAPCAFDCGQACVLMLLRDFSRQFDALTVEALTRRRAGRTSAAALVDLAAHYGMSVTARTPARDKLAAALRESIRDEKPVIALVNYLSLGFANPIAIRNDPGFHWLVLAGFEGDWLRVHDPLWTSRDRDGRGGAGVPIHADTLAEAYRGWTLAASAELDVE